MLPHEEDTLVIKSLKTDKQIFSVVLSAVKRTSNRRT